MKLSILFLASCLMATSFGQNLFYWPFYPSASVGRSGGLQWPRSYYRGAVGFYNHPDSYVDEADYVDEPSDEVYGRSKLQSKKRLPQINKINQNKGQIDDARQFSPRNSITTVTTYTTKYASTSVVTLFAISTCYTKTLFTANATPCRRRRRDARMILESIEPTPQFNQIETTVVATGNEADPGRVERDIESSKDLERYLQHQDDDIIHPRFGFNNLINNILFPASTSTFTSTITLPVDYSFAKSVSTKTVANAFAATTALSCIPVEFTVCP